MKVNISIRLVSDSLPALILTRTTTTIIIVTITLVENLLCTRDDLNYLCMSPHLILTVIPPHHFTDEETEVRCPLRWEPSVVCTQSCWHIEPPYLHEVTHPRTFR